MIVMMMVMMPSCGWACFKTHSTINIMLYPTMKLNSSPGESSITPPFQDAPVPEGPNDAISCLRWSPAANIFACGSWDKSILAPKVTFFLAILVKVLRSFLSYILPRLDEQIHILSVQALVMKMKPPNLYFWCWGVFTQGFSHHGRLSLGVG